MQTPVKRQIGQCQRIAPSHRQDAKNKKISGDRRRKAAIVCSVWIRLERGRVSEFEAQGGGKDIIIPATQPFNFLTPTANSPFQRTDLLNHIFRDL
jgi:hypothetical protein